MANARFSTDGTLLWWCPGCDGAHGAPTVTPNKKGCKWTYNGDIEAPTLSPSVVVYGDDPAKKCHCYITAGQVRFLDDCAHALKGQTVEIPGWPWDTETLGLPNLT